MSFGGFGKNSGPSTPPAAQNPFAQFPRLPSPSPPRPISPRSSINYSGLDASGSTPSPPLASSRPFPGRHDPIDKSYSVPYRAPPPSLVVQKNLHASGQYRQNEQSNGPPLRWDDVKASPFKDHDARTYQRPPALLSQNASSNSRTGPPAKTSELRYIERANLPYSQSLDEISKNTSPLDKSYSVPYRAPSPSLVVQKNLYAGGQNRHNEQHHFASSMGGNHSKSSSHNTTPPAQLGTPSVSTTGGSYQSGPVFQTKHTDGPFPKRTRSPTLLTTGGVSREDNVSGSGGHQRSLVNYRDLDAPEAMPSPPLAFDSSFPSRDPPRPFAGAQNHYHSRTWANQSTSSINNTTQLVQEDMPSVSTSGAYQSGRTFQTTHVDGSLPKRTRSPTIPSPSGGFTQNPAIASDGYKRAHGFPNQIQSPTSVPTISVETSINKPMHFPAVKRTKIPLLSSPDKKIQENLDPAEDIERELHAKAKRLARFKDELSQPVESHPTVRNQTVATKMQHHLTPEREREDPTMDVMGDTVGGNFSSEYEGVASPSNIVGVCPDMCPGSERAERERKGDLDQYERLDGDRNLTSEFLAVKKYTRTAEREAELIRPMPILRNTMDYLLNLLDEPYDDRFLGLYNFLWDRMRAIRMDLRMQHIFNLEAISMLEQMIRLHIIAMHELCEYTKGEGFSEGFDAHLNIEQMNKTSVELFQFYDDHRKKGVHVSSEREFRGYYALLKLDKHPGYKVEPAELSLDLAKMTAEMRQTPEVVFARDVARACRTGNFIAFFRLAHKASYLQACLMHAHFSKLRTQALASLHAGLQINQGIPITHVAKWLGMEEEDIGDLLEYYGFSLKDFEEPYMVKDNAFINVDKDFPVKRSKLVNGKRSRVIASDVSLPSLTELYSAEEVKEFQLRKNPEPIPVPLQPVVPVNTTQFHDQKMHDFGTILSPKSPKSPKGNMHGPMDKTAISLLMSDKKMVGHEAEVTPASPLVLDFSNSASEYQRSRVESAQKPKFEPVFRNSFGRSIKHDVEATAPITPESAEENRLHVVPLNSVVHTPIPQPMFTEDLEDEEETGIMEEDNSDEVATSYYNKEVVEAKLKLILRLIWKRRTAKKRELREHKQLAANAALSLLSLGPPIWRFEVQSGDFHTFNIDHVMSERHEIQERSWSVLNPSDVVAAKLIERNQDAKFLCWKLVLCSQEASVHKDNVGSWLHSKLMPGNNDGDGDLLVSSPGLAIWRNWISTQSGVDPTCCLSVIKSIQFEDINKSITGASAVLFVLSDHIPLEIQKKRLHDIVMSLPSGSRLPLLILSGSRKDESNTSDIAYLLGLHNIDKQRVVMLDIVFLKDRDTKKMDGFFSDKHLREALEWLASESPPQIVLTETKTRELVLSHLNSTLGILEDTNTHGVGPNNCISAFNEALDQSMKQMAAAAHANPIGWPCPEIDFLEKSTDEYRAAVWYLPSIGWSSPSRTDMLISALNDLKLPVFEDDLSWLHRGLNIGDDIESLISRLENCLIGYLTETSKMMGVDLAQKEAGIVLQKNTRLELHNTTYYIIPKWASIFRRLFSWRLMNLNRGEVSSVYTLLLQQKSSEDDTESKSSRFPPPHVVHLSLDEMVEISGFHRELGSNQTEHEAFQTRSLPPMAYDDAVIMEHRETNSQDSLLTSYDHSIAEEENEDGVQVVHMTKAASINVTDKLTELLEKCNIVQNQIDKKLSFYF
ncbi:hypothetical protein ABFX02_07G023600 [Erythranthe guttata]